MQRYKSILNPIIFTLEITECILLQAFGILIEFTIVSENNEHLPYPSVVRLTLLYFWPLWPESVLQVLSIQTPEAVGCDCQYSL